MTTGETGDGSMRLCAEDLACERGDRLVFEGVSFSIVAGEVVTLLGPNGVGKTTLLRALGGLLRPSDGAVTVEGRPGDDRPLRALVHFVGPQDALKSAMTVRENLAFWQQMLGTGASDMERVGSALEALGLVELADIPAGLLSTGQRRRAGLARLLAVPRPIWLLDEPTLGLDVASRQLLAEMLVQHVEADGLALVATHTDLGLSDVRSLRLGVEWQEQTRVEGLV